MEDRHGQTQMTPLLTRTGRPQDYEVSITQMYICSF